MPDKAAADAGAMDMFFKSGPGQTAVMATVVTFAGQAAAQLGVPAPGPTLAAIAFALLVAVYNVRTVQKLDGVNGLVLIPIAALVAFTSGWGANGLIGAAASGTQADLGSLVRALQQENAGLERRLSLQADELRVLRELAGVRPVSPGGRSGRIEYPGGGARALSRALDLLAPAAHAQPSPATTPPVSVAERARLLLELQEYQAQQKKLSDDAERLRREREALEKRTRQIQQAPQGLWQKW